MTFIEALLLSRPASGDLDGTWKGIRRDGWKPGFRIQWLPARMSWACGEADVYLNQIDQVDDDYNEHIIDEFDEQGCLTPITMLADDWQVTP